MRQVRPLLRARADEVCELCGERRGEEAHHRQKRRGPDRDVLSNLLWLCSACHHVRVHAHPSDARLMGWIVSEVESPAATPVFRRGILVLLADSGEVLTTDHSY
ncbi:HNH endonuclease [Nakamurella silvestris]|nr:HNH endonuclease [Nakamurella silvestris]